MSEQHENQWYKGIFLRQGKGTVQNTRFGLPAGPQGQMKKVEHNFRLMPKQLQHCSSMGRSNKSTTGHQQYYAAI